MQRKPTSIPMLLLPFLPNKATQIKKTMTTMKKKSGSQASPRFRSHHSPNYMKSRAKSRNVQLERATCSSTLKDSRFHDYLKLHRESEGTSDVKICRYSYCSFNGHLHSLSPPLKSFVSERRRALKAKGNVNVRCQLPKANPENCAEIRGRDESATSHGEMCHDFGSREDIKQIGDLDSKGKEIESDERFGWFFDEISGDRVSQESFDEESVNWDSVSLHNKNGSSFQGNQNTSKFPQSGGDATVSCNAMDGEKPNLKGKSPSNEDATTEIGNISQASSSVEEMSTFVHSNECKTIKHDDQDHNRAENLNGESTEDLKGECNNAVQGLNSRNTKRPDTDKRLTVKHNKSPNQESDDPRRYNLRGPHLLHVEPEPGAEEVNLRHQELEARKKPEEWMVDYALRQAVKRDGSRRKVALLVQAFEKVVPETRL